MRVTDYVNTQPLANPAAADYIPTFLYDGLPDPSGRPDVEIRNDFFGTRRKLRIGVLGAGISGLNFLHFAERLHDVDIVVYEMNDDVGGVVRGVVESHFPLKAWADDLRVVADEQVSRLSM